LCAFSVVVTNCARVWSWTAWIARGGSAPWLAATIAASRS